MAVVDEDAEPLRTLLLLALLALLAVDNTLSSTTVVPRNKCIPENRNTGYVTFKCVPDSN